MEYLQPCEALTPLEHLCAHSESEAIHMPSEAFKGIQRHSKDISGN